MPTEGDEGYKPPLMGDGQPRRRNISLLQAHFPVPEKWKRIGREVALAAGFLCAFDIVFHNRYCGLLFQCGCTWIWAGGADNCNVHGKTGAALRCVALRCIAWHVAACRPPSSIKGRQDAKTDKPLQRLGSDCNSFLEGSESPTDSLT